MMAARSLDVHTRAAYRHCERVTRGAAANFYYGIRLLPAHKRRAMCAVYAFARRIDDIGDGPLEREEKLRRLDAAGRALRELSGEHSEDPVLVALADAHERFGLPLEALEDLIEGVRMDVAGVVYEHREELLLYCRRVAGSIGRLCLAIFGSSRNPEAADRLAEDLGVAMQLTNILRDVREDAETGRVYLPAEDLKRFGLIAAGEERSAAAALAQLARGGTSAEQDTAWLQALVRYEAAYAREWFDRGLALVALLDRRSAACVLAMVGIYRRLLDRVEEHPERALRRRVTLPAWEKGWVATRSVFGADP
jgi:15-cis-phytoene synthase